MANGNVSPDQLAAMLNSTNINRQTAQQINMDVAINVYAALVVKHEPDTYQDHVRLAHIACKAMPFLTPNLIPGVTVDRAKWEKAVEAAEKSFASDEGEPSK